MKIKVNLTKLVHTSQGLRYCPVIVSTNGRIKPNNVMVGGVEERHDEGTFYLDWSDKGSRKRVSVGKDASQAQTQRMRKQAELGAKAVGFVSPVSEPSDPNGLSGLSDAYSPNHPNHLNRPNRPNRLMKSESRPLVAAIQTFLEETKHTKKPKTYAAYATTLAYFQTSCGKDYIEDIQRIDMLRFATYLKEQGLAPRTCWNKFNNTMTFLKAYGIRDMVKKNDWPKFVEEEPEVYEKEQIESLFDACDREDRLLFSFYLMTGLREQEVIYMTWKDVNFSRQTITVRWKPEFGWTPKNYKERELPMPDKLAAQLKSARQRSEKGCDLVFHTAGCKPKFDALHILKAIAKRAGMDPDLFWLHKFRSTFATWSLWGGVDLRTVQNHMGHVDMESTMRYLKPSRSQAVRDKMNDVFA